MLKLLELPFLARQRDPVDEKSPELVTFSDDDDLDLALYYLRVLSSILRWANEPMWAILARKTVSSRSNIPFFSEIGELYPFPITEREYVTNTLCSGG